MVVLRNRATWWPAALGLVLGLALILVLAGCGRDATPTSIPTQGELSTPAPEPIPTVIVSLTQEQLYLTLLSPTDGAEVASEGIRVLGRTRLDAAVAVNGIPVEVGPDGTFQMDVMLEEGANLIEVVSTDLYGQLSSQSAAVFFKAPEFGLPLNLFYPPDGLEISRDTVIVTGGTNPDAAVAINGIPVEINALGIFSQTVSLEEGVNLIEVVGTDLQADSRSLSIAVFYVR